MLSFIRKHPGGVGAGAVILVAALAWLAFGFFGVHTLFVDDVVDEAGPVFDTPPAAAAPPATDPVTPDATSPGIAPGIAPTDSSSIVSTPTDAAPQATFDPARPAPTTPPTPPTPVTPTPMPVVELVGTFESGAHPTSGEATVIGNGTGQRFLRFENFETDNGPDLNVYLVNSSTGDVSDFIDLGDLKGNIGDQNYEIPVGLDLEVYDEVAIWCVRFGVGFGEARLVTA